MRKKLFRIYVAVSLDSYVARSSGAVDWLDDYDPMEFNFETFLDQVGTLIIGRRTFDQVMSYGAWPYGDRRTVVLTSYPIEDAPENTVAFGGSLMELGDALRNERIDNGDVWIVGGASVINQFLMASLVDKIDLFVIPVMLGEGISLFGKDTSHLKPMPIATHIYPSGVVRMEYKLK
ncbi:dihydrofolate reductase family protein [uncultured Thalassospira sp.]|uniref:dihydrofolate reductase family protein n=1 Tax=uncultured Thalassospira sp. TaxID=404382 RepID=UPI0030DB8451|tara:strand:- start:464 stop:994 length:531 start_codon:yes stop_codon:yes gene_type:complete